MLDAASFLGLGLIFVETIIGNILLLCFSLGVRGSHGRFRVGLPGGTSCPYLAALARCGVGAVAGGRLVRAGELGRRVCGFAIDFFLIGITVILIASRTPRANARYPVIMTLFCTMMSRIPLCAAGGSKTWPPTSLRSRPTGPVAEYPLGGGTIPAGCGEAQSLAIFVVRATLLRFLTRYGAMWPVLTAFSLFILALPILVQPRNE